MSTKNISEKQGSVLKNFVKALTSGDQDGVRACFKEDAVWHVLPYYVKIEGRTDGVGKEGIIEILFATPSEFYKPETIKIDTHFR